MKVVIDITPDMWKQIQTSYAPDGIVSCIKNGTILPDELQDETDVDETFDIIRKIYKRE